MNKKLKLYFILSSSALMVTWWALLFFTNTRGQYINYWWQVFMGITALLYALLGILTAAKWGWLKSGVGRGIFFISLGLMMWGLGQLGWSWYLFADPSIEAVPSHIPDYIYFSALPLWFFGILELSKSTGARYGLKKTSGKILVLLLSIIMVILSWYFLVEVARGGMGYFNQGQDFITTFFDLGYSIGDAIMLTIVFAIFGLSWKILGGRFRVPIVTILSGFLLLYFADFSFSYFNGKGEYFNGNTTDLFFFLMAASLGLGLSMLDPTHIRKQAKKPIITPVIPDSLLKSDLTINDTAPTLATNQDTIAVEAVPEYINNNPVAPYARPHDNSVRKKEDA